MCIRDSPQTVPAGTVFGVGVDGGVVPESHRFDPLRPQAFNAVDRTGGTADVHQSFHGDVYKRQAQHRIAYNRQQRVECQAGDNGLFAGADDDHDQAEHCQGGNGLEQVSQVEDHLPGLGEEVGDHTQEQSRYNGNADGTEYNGEMFNQDVYKRQAQLSAVWAFCPAGWRSGTGGTPR